MERAYLKQDFRGQAYASMGLGKALVDACFEASQREEPTDVMVAPVDVADVELEVTEDRGCVGTLTYATSPTAVHIGQGELSSPVANVVQQLYCITQGTAAPRCHLRGITSCFGQGCQYIPDHPEKIADIPKDCRWTGVIIAPDGKAIEFE